MDRPPPSPASMMEVGLPNETGLGKKSSAAIETFRFATFVPSPFHFASPTFIIDRGEGGGRSMCRYLYVGDD